MSFYWLVSYNIFFFWTPGIFNTEVNGAFAIYTLCTTRQCKNQNRLQFGFMAIYIENFEK